jgi:hypothetical protein
MHFIHLLSPRAVAILALLAPAASPSFFEVANFGQMASHISCQDSKT